MSLSLLSFHVILLESVLDLFDQSRLLSIGMSIGMTTGMATILPRFRLGNRIVLDSTLSTGQCGMSTGTLGVGLEQTVGVVVSAFTPSVGVGSKVLVGGTELRDISTDAAWEDGAQCSVYGDKGEGGE